MTMLTRIKNKIARRLRYRRTWGTPAGKDCVSLDTSLCRWLGARLLFLAEHTNSHPNGWGYEAWKTTLHLHGTVLALWGDHFELVDHTEEETAYANAQDSLRWVADNLGDLWD